jgi:DNA mismatch repair protein MutL
MESKIRVLDEHTINKIAAGEVIENPASVVKELTENALDAGATEIVVEITGGGRGMIRISDNGCGMGADDALLCLERHATSKIRQVEQLHEIYTMGFRGEALPSIASISKFTLITSAEEAKGTMILVEGGKILGCSPAVRSRGTTIEVKSLFFNLPVRKKFLKSPLADTHEVQKLLSILSLGNPEVKIQLIVDSKPVFTHREGSRENFGEALDKRVLSVLGEEFLNGSAPVSRDSKQLKIEGRIGLPAQSRHNRTAQYLFVNRRPVFSPLIAFAVKQGYGTSLPESRYPAFVLHLSIPAELVDVNVHPQKKEVRFRQEASIKELLLQGVHHALHQTQPASSSQPVIFMPVAERAELFLTPPPSRSEMELFPRSNPQSVLKSFCEQEELPPFLRQEPLNQEKPNMQQAAPALPNSLPPLPKVIAAIPRYIILEGSLTVFLQTYFPNHAPGGFLLVDQKAAHARVIFDALMKQKEKGSLSQQSLLVPYQVRLPPHEAALLRHSLESLRACALSIREFGTDTFLIDALPEIFGDSHVEQFFTELLAGLSTAAISTEIEEKMQREIERKLALAASRAASQAQLPLHQAQELIRQLALSSDPHFSPSGKKIVAYLSAEEIAKYFQKMV